MECSFSNSKLFHLTQVGSDHSPVMLVTDSTIPNCWKPFNFFLPWLNDENCATVIANAWKTGVIGSPAFELLNRFQITRIKLPLWNKENFGNINQKVDHMHMELNTIQEGDSDTHNEIISITRNLTSETKSRVCFINKSREHFMKDMDYNSKYFHAKTNRTRTRNNIDSI